MKTEIKTILFLAAIVVVFLNVTGKADAATYYVSQNDSNASDANPGTEDLPWETLKHATLTVVAGDTVIVKEGEYTDENAYNPDRVFQPASNGILENPIVFRSEPRWAARIGKNSAGLANWAIDGKSYITIDGFYFYGNLKAIWGDHINLINNHMEGGNAIVTLTDPSIVFGITIQAVDYCNLSNNYIHNIVSSGVANHNSGAIMVFGSGTRASTHNVIKNNTVIINNGSVWNGIGTKGGAINDNIFENNFISGVTAGFNGMGSTDEVTDSFRSIIRNNVVIDSNYFIDLDHGARDFEIYNNTFYDGERFVSAYQVSNTGEKLFNNIGNVSQYFYAWGGYSDPPEPFTTLINYSDYNNSYGGYSIFARRTQSPDLNYGLVEFQSNYSFDLNTIETDPNFINPGGTSPEDYKRLGYSSNGRGGAYSSVMGAYITGNEIIGYSESATTFRSDVDNSSVTNTTDALLTLRNSLGLSMDGPPW
ncbi:MAG TPA: hypothetical protein DEA46_00715 [Candidatus Moranbacteria bacterium]|nr:hypothetical protein [Candidatus Moranbacteria bacterium]